MNYWEPDRDGLTLRDKSNSLRPTQETRSSAWLHGDRAEVPFPRKGYGRELCDSDTFWCFQSCDEIAEAQMISKHHDQELKNQ